MVYEMELHLESVYFEVKYSNIYDSALSLVMMICIAVLIYSSPFMCTNKFTICFLPSLVRFTF